MNEIFVSYRRQDSADITGRIRHDLVSHFGDDQVFNDVYSVRKGQNFRKAIARAIKSCKVYLVIVGPDWVTITDSQGRRRLDNEDDNVRIELETALERENLPIVPLFVGGAKMPHKDELPESLKEFTSYNGGPIRSGRDYDRDIADLIADVASRGVKRTTGSDRRTGGLRKLIIVTMLLLAVVAMASYFSFRPVPPQPTPVADNSQATVQRVQQELNSMDFVAGTEDGLLGASTRTAIMAFQRASGLEINGTPSALLLDQLGRAAAKGFSNVTCSTGNSTSQDCKPVTKTRTGTTTTNQVQNLSAVLPCYYEISMFCDMFGNCNWAGIEAMCEDSPGGLAQLQQQCFGYNGQITDYDATCACSPMSCGCEVTADCTYVMQSMQPQTYTETECRPVNSSQLQCSCKAPEVCPPNIR